MKMRQTANFVLCCVAAIGCSPASHPPSVASSTVPVSTNACAHAQFKSEQFTGDWTEAGDTTVTTLDADGTLKSHGGNNTQSGTWSYEPWKLTPAKNQIPAGEADHCVLWLHWQLPAPELDLVYVPLKVSATSLQLSYVGRGNTLTWVRPAAGGAS